MNRGLGVLMAAALLPVGAAAQTQASGPAAQGRYFYTGKVGLFSKTSEYRIDARGGDLALYTGSDQLIFDRRSFAVVHVKGAPEGFDPKIESNAPAGVPAVGSSWQARYRQPANAASRCPADSEQEMSATVQPEETLSLEVAGTRTDVALVVVKVSGTWVSCGLSGTWTATRKYAPALGVMALTDSATFYEGRQIAGGSLRLDHVEK